MSTELRRDGNAEHPEPTVDEVREALLRLERAEEAEEDARAARSAAELHLAEVIGVQRRDKDTGFDAKWKAERLLVQWVLDDHYRRHLNVLDDGIARLHPMTRATWEDSTDMEILDRRGDVVNALKHLREMCKPGALPSEGGPG